MRVSVSQQELAALVGASRESVARGIRQLRSEGVVVTQYRGLTIVDAKKLQALANAG